ncbi:MAG: ATP-binding cassette domain-containing protein [Gammaproteobacteria bacterium]|jgi:sodium transport system ATP-binding protein
MIRLESISKSFGDVLAVDEVSFRAADGRVTALLGPNGAGKSTCLRILSTVLRADSGRAWVGDHEVGTARDEVLKAIGVLPHATGLYNRLTARENIAYFGELHGIDRNALEQRIAHLIDELEMADFADRKVAGFSQGQRIKVALARAVVHDPQHLILDEPTNGLDVMATRALREIILSLKDRGRCVLFSSHIMQEVQNLCDDVVIIGGGRVCYEGTLAGLRQTSGQDDLEEAFISMVGVEE